MRTIAVMILMILSLAHVPLVSTISTVTPSSGQTSPRVYLGAWLNGSVLDMYREWRERTGKGLAIFATMAALYPDEPVPSTGLPWITLTQRLAEALPWMKEGLFYGICLTWMMSYNSTSTGIEAFEITQKVANGDYDSLIRANALWIKNSFPYKLFIRLDHEFNLGNWGWSRDAVTYIRAWRRVVDDFRIENVQVEWVWSPNFQDNPSTIHYQDYYPSDDYVDWIGVDVYANSWIHSPAGWTAEEMLSCRGANNLSIYEFALLHDKPFMLAEWGLNITRDMTDEQNAGWLTGMFDAIEKRQDLRAIIHWGGSPWYLLDNPVAASVYKDRVSGAKYSALYP